MKQNQSVPVTLEQIKKQILELPPAERKQLSEEILSFLLFGQQANDTTGKGPSGSGTSQGLTPEQLKIIKDLGEQTRNLNNMMGDDLYFFM